MKLYANWLEILKKAWSIRFGVLATIFSVMQIVLPIYTNVLPRDLFAVLTAFAAIGVIFARLVWQKDV